MIDQLRQFPRREKEAFISVIRGENHYAPCVLAPVTMSADCRVIEPEDADIFTAVQAVQFLERAEQDGSMVWLQDLMMSEHMREKVYFATWPGSILHVYDAWPEPEKVHHYRLKELFGGN